MARQAAATSQRFARRIGAEHQYRSRQATAGWAVQLESVCSAERCVRSCSSGVSLSHRIRAIARRSGRQACGPSFRSTTAASGHVHDSWLYVNRQQRMPRPAAVLGTAAPAYMLGTVAHRWQVGRGRAAQRMAQPGIYPAAYSQMAAGFCGPDRTPHQCASAAAYMPA